MTDFNDTFLDDDFITSANKITNSRLAWFRSLSFKVSAILMIILLLISAVVYWLIKTQGRDALISESEKLTAQVGSSAVNRLSTGIAEIEALTKAQAAVVTSVANERDTLVKVLSENLDRQKNDDILSGGYWSAPGREIESEYKALVWDRNDFGLFEYENRYEQDDRYLQEEWFNIAFHAKPGDCAWSRLYADEMTEQTKMTCAVAVRRKRDFIGVATVDVNLSGLNQFAAITAEKTGGYVFITDKDNRFIAFGASQGVIAEPLAIIDTTIAQQREKFSEFQPIMDEVMRFDQTVIDNAKTRLADQFSVLTKKLSDDARSLSKDQAAMDIATLNDLSITRFDSQNSTQFATAKLAADRLLGDKPSTAYLFLVPNTFWKLGIIIPNAKATALADTLSSQLLFLLLPIIALLVLFSYYLIERQVILPIKHTAKQMGEVANLIDQKQYLALNKQKLNTQKKDEVTLVRGAVNLLIDRVVENEGALANINKMLEKKVQQRTKALTKAMTELKRSQLQLVQSEKMSLLGQMVAGVAHEVNTPLGYVKSNVLMIDELLEYHRELLALSRQLDHQIAEKGQNAPEVQSTISSMSDVVETIDNDEIESSLSEIHADTLFGVSQISEIISGLKDFARIDESKVKAVNIHDCIEGSLKIAKSNLVDVQVIKRFDYTLPTIVCAPSQINQVFLNLFNNAAHATEHKPSRKLKITTQKNENYIIIHIHDNGVGMSNDLVKKIFDPFFTTKPAGKGTGLGLAICRQIIEQHQGHLKVLSKPNQGTRFSIYLPLNT